MPPIADTHVAHCHTTYRFFAPQQATTLAVQARLDRVLSEYVRDDWQAALQQVLVDDPAVYVLRRVNSRLWLNVGDEVDARIGQRWGQQLAGAVVRAISAASAGDGTLARFADWADYVAHFMIDLVRGAAWGCWYYSSFQALRTLSISAALVQVLRQHRDDAPAIVRQLHENGQLDEVLTTLAPADLQHIWAKVFGANATLSPEALRPLFAAACRLITSLDLWRNTVPDQAIAVERYCMLRPAVPDWRDTRALAQAILDALRFLKRGGQLKPIDLRSDALTSKLDNALVTLDWLDVDWLRLELPRVLSEEPSPSFELSEHSEGDWTPRQHQLPGNLNDALEHERVELDADWLRVEPPRALSDESAIPFDLPTRGGGDWTPRQRQLLSDLIDVLEHERVELGHPLFNIPAYALRLYAALIARSPQWADDHLAVTLIGQLLERWMKKPPTATPTERVVGQASSASDQQQTFFDLLTGQARPARTAGFATSCAGAFLLLRAILDLHLPTLIEDAQYPPGLSAVLRALGARWCGVEFDHADRGLLALIGAKGDTTLAALREAWTTTSRADHARLQMAVLQRLSVQRLVSGARLHVYRVPIDDGLTALIGGDESLNMWPMSCALTSNEVEADVITEWLDRWSEVVGRRPLLVTTESYLDEEIGREHQQGRESLLAALAALRAGRLNLPEADLTIALLATSVLRVGAHWLRQFAASSVPYLLANFVRRAGTIWPHAQGLTIELARQPLDIVIEMAGYTAAIERVPWLADRSVQFVWREGS